MVERVDGGEVRRLRERLMLTQAELAKRCGSTQPMISKVETGESGLSAKTLRALAKALGVSMDALMAPVDSNGTGDIAVRTATQDDGSSA